MAARPLGVWGIDLGQCALKALRLEVQDGQVVATAFEYIEHPKILSQPDADPDELTREALTQFLERNKIAGDMICISVPGQSGLARFVKLPPVDEKKIADIVKFEAKQQIPFPLEEVVWDFQRLNRGEIVEGMALETEIGLFAMKRDMVFRAIRQLKEVNVEIHVVQMAPLALCNFVAYDLLGKGTDNADGEEENHECIVCLEIGTDNSNLVITDGGRIIWQRPIPIGGNHFTRALTKEMKLTFAKAEHLKRNAAKSPELKKILSALKQVLNDFVGEVQRSLGYFTNTHRNAQIQYMVGLGNAFRLPGLQKFLQEKLQLEVRKLQRLERAGGESVTTAPTFAENIMSFGVAYGLCLQGLGKARLQTNLLPYEVRLERVIRGKKPWMVAAAASLLFGMSMIALASGMEKSRVEAEENMKAAKDAEKIAKEAADNEAKHKAAAELLKKSEDSLKRIGAGVDERMNWQLMLQYVNLVTPQPNGTRLVKRAENGVAVWNKHWNNNNEAKKAYDEYIKEKLGATKDESAEKKQARDRLVKEHLIQVNLIGINALYSDDLYPFYVKIESESKFLTGMSQADKEKIQKYVGASDDATRKAMTDAEAPFKDGWIVEIRGYTYHKQPIEFLEETLIENLRASDRLEDIAQFMDIEIKGKIKEKVGFVHLYKQELVKAPVPGRFNIISRSYLRELWKGAAPAVAGPEAQPNPQATPQEGQKEKPSRDQWKPIGETASGALVEGVGAGPGGGGGGVIEPAAKGLAPVPRFEFVILFIWREPTGAPTVGAPAEKKDQP